MLRGEQSIGIAVNRDIGGPAVLLVGAQKAGTTSLADDLSSIGIATVGERKEPNHLSAVLTPSAARSYERNFSAVPGRWLDASTTNAMRSLYPLAPANAKDLFGDDVFVVYIVRQPVARMLSHHQHESSRGLLPPDFSEAISAHPELVLNGCYSWQLEPWVEQFGRERVLLLTLDEYRDGRADTLRAVANFVGANLDANALDQPAPVLNQSGQVGFARNKLLRKVLASRAYNDIVRVAIPERIRVAASSTLQSTPIEVTCPTDDELLGCSRLLFADLQRLSQQSFAAGSHTIPSSWLTDLEQRAGAASELPPSLSRTASMLMYSACD